MQPIVNSCVLKSTPAYPNFATVRAAMATRFTTDFGERLKMALFRIGVKWESSTEVGKFFGKDKNTVARWLKGGYPHVTEWPNVRARFYERANDIHEDWLLHGLNPPKWAQNLDPATFSKEKPDVADKQLLPQRKSAARKVISGKK